MIENAMSLMEKGGEVETRKEMKEEEEERESGGEGRTKRQGGRKERKVKKEGRKGQQKESIKTQCANIAVFTSWEVYNVIERQSNEC